MVELTGRLPDLLVACVGGGSNAIGLFYEFVGDASVKMVGVEAGRDRHRLGKARRDSDRGAARSASRRTQLPAPGRERPGA